MTAQIASVETKSGKTLVNGEMELVTQFDYNCGDNAEENCYFWQDMLEDLDALMGEFNDSNEWVCRVENFGWRKTHGLKTFKAKRPDLLLREILPKTDNTFKIFRRRHKYENAKCAINEIVIQNWHHDSCTGDEHYYIAKKVD